MNQHEGNPLLWSQSHYQSHLDCAGEDFSGFINFGDINLDIPSFDGNPASVGESSKQHNHNVRGKGEQDAENAMDLDYGHGHGHGHAHHGGMEQQMMDVSDHDFAQLEQSVAHLMEQNVMGNVPPTPNSMEMRSQEQQKGQYRTRTSNYADFQNDPVSLNFFGYTCNC